jgi:hypothetical protein
MRPSARALLRESLSVIDVACAYRFSTDLKREGSRSMLVVFSGGELLHQQVRSSRLGRATKVSELLFTRSTWITDRAKLAIRCVFKSVEQISGGRHRTPAARVVRSDQTPSKPQFETVSSAEPKS